MFPFNSHLEQEKVLGNRNYRIVTRVIELMELMELLMSEKDDLDGTT